MPVVSERSDITTLAQIPSPTVGARLAQVVTTTLFQANPTQSAATHGSTTAIPVGAIAGGVAAGALLAVVVTTGWICWGKSIKRGNAIRQKEVEALRKTKSNTLHNATASKSGTNTYRPIFTTRPLNKKVKFAAHEISGPRARGGANRNAPKAPPPSQVHNKVVLSPEAAPSPVPALEDHPSEPKLLASAGLVAHTQPETKPIGLKTSNSSLLPTHLSHRPSTISSASVYSTASGEEHQVRVPPNLILAALGDFSEKVGETLRGAADRRHSLLSLSGWSRSSSIAQGSPTQSSPLGSTAYPQDDSGVPIGYAY